MKKDWKIITEDDNISLHDHMVSSFDFGKDILLRFEDGFDVTKNHSCNETMRHKQTGAAAVVLHNAVYIKGVKFLPDNKEQNVAQEELGTIELEVLEFSFCKEKRKVEIFGEAWDECWLCRLEFTADKVSYCWDDFVDDAWFQDWEK